MKENYIFLSNSRVQIKEINQWEPQDSGRMVVHIASAKNPQCEGSTSPSSFYGKLLEYQSYNFSLIYPVDEFSLKEMRRWGQYKISSYSFCVWCESRKSGGIESSRFSCVISVVGTASDRLTFRIPSNMNDGAPLRKQPMSLTH